MFIFKSDKKSAIIDRMKGRDSLLESNRNRRSKISKLSELSKISKFLDMESIA